MTAFIKGMFVVLGRALMRVGVALAGKEMAIWLLRTWVERTDNTLDDSVVDLSEAALNNASPRELRKLAKNVGSEALDVWDAR